MATRDSVKRWGQVVLAAVMVSVAGGCGMSVAVRGNPVAPTDIVIEDTATPLPTSDTTEPVSPSQTTDPPPSSSSPPRTTAAGETTPATPDGPAAVVQAYFDAINGRDYQRAWALGGRNVGQSYASFVSGFATTDRDVLTIRSTQGNTVTADVTAYQTDGTVRTFHGTYTVTGGVITRFAVRPT